MTQPRYRYAMVSQTKNIPRECHVTPDLCLCSLTGLVTILHAAAPGPGVQQTLGVGVHMPGERHPGQQREHRAQAVHDQQDGVGPPQAHCRGPALSRVMVTHAGVI